MELVVLFLILFVSYALSIPMGGTQFDNSGTGSETSCTQYYYAMFEGDICGVVVFTGMEEGEVTVQTSGKGICGLPSSSGPFPYQSNAHLYARFISRTEADL